jgi:hypothetical protein
MNLHTRAFKAAIRAGIGATVAVASLVAVASVADADPALCESGEVCIYENYDYNNGAVDNRRQWTTNDTDYTNNTWFNVTSGSWTSDGLNDETSSVRNSGNSCNVRLQQNTGTSSIGSTSTFNLGAADGNLSNNNIGDNRASGHQWCV